ncbi:uncharacterized protein LOC131291224 [Anopheles ziemanni]|uniref:uncharacterized protein LOC131269391 n=1 Tax=Anopheles coustani TaxID=139045 RepID=UPI002657BD7C|nr:uncharacterized protein LOC131269391 [Anopheles coustani]XP_058176393.1 uncharacterized protein LOC131291224 [Anopheles ziemanni]
MGNVPMERLAAYQRPFTYTGVDYFGPLSVEVGRRVEKRWGVLFTCLTVRAIHLEVAHSLTTSSCILAIQRFIALRGKPVEIISDCGTNFVGASHELCEAWKEVNERQLAEEFTSSSFIWKFNPPGAPHFGGCWERLIKSVKKVLGEIKLPRLPTDEVLLSTFGEVQTIVNSRPLTHVPLNDEFEPPNHFLVGTANGEPLRAGLNVIATMLKMSWKASQVLANIFWKKWIKEYLPTLTRRTNWFAPVRPIEVGDIVLIVDGDLPRNTWPMGRVVKVVKASDGQVQRATVKTANGFLERPATKLAVLDVKVREP